MDKALIGKLRKKMKPFMVLRSDGMFGDFKSISRLRDKDLTYFTKVLARTPREAAKRYMKRTNAIKDLCRLDEVPEQTNETFGILKIIPLNTPYNRLTTYWK